MSKDEFNVADMKIETLRSLVKENDIDVEGTGKNGTVTRKDLEKAIEAYDDKYVIKGDDKEKEYVVVKDFTDLEDDNHVYKENHVYPRNNKKPDPERVEELSTTKNRRKEVLIKEKGE